MELATITISKCHRGRLAGEPGESTRDFIGSSAAVFPSGKRDSFGVALTAFRLWWSVAQWARTKWHCAYFGKARTCPNEGESGHRGHSSGIVHCVIEKSRELTTMHVTLMSSNFCTRQKFFFLPNVRRYLYWTISQLVTFHRLVKFGVSIITKKFRSTLKLIENPVRVNLRAYEDQLKIYICRSSSDWGHNSIGKTMKKEKANVPKTETIVRGSEESRMLRTERRDWFGNRCSRGTYRTTLLVGRKSANRTWRRSPTVISL